jgi:hypothetical protein
MASGNRQSENGDGFIYIFKAGDVYKIGRTNNVGRRLSEIQRTHPAAEVYHSRKVQYVASLEESLHGFFDSKRVRDEWFSLDESDLNLAVHTIGVMYGA